MNVAKMPTLRMIDSHRTGIAIESDSRKGIVNAETARLCAVSATVHIGQLVGSRIICPDAIPDNIEKWTPIMRRNTARVR